MDHGERLKAALADRYAIEREIGSGGMATVYPAQDLKHDRTVAIKVLDPDLAESLGAERFLREIKTAANLTHPHILPLHDSGEADGFLFYVMPYVEGESLRSRLTKEKQLPVEDAVQITREIADALAYAHEKGVIHRDVKPANILLEAGHAVLADFGVAHAVAEAKDDRLTRTGTSLGTPEYMSPEQGTGERDLDGRTDQYALGCVLYEMLTGYPPFTGAQVEAVVRQHLTAEPPSVTEVRPSVPVEVEKVISRALAKSPADRFKTTREMAAALALTTSLGRREAKRPLRPVGIGLVAATLVALVVGYFGFFRDGDSEGDLVENRVLVTDFENKTGDPELYLIGHMAADLIFRELGQLEPGLVEVMPMDASRAALQRVGSQEEGAPGGGPICVAAAQMDVGLAISGSLYATGDSLSVEAQMIDVAGCRLLRTFPPATASSTEPGPGLVAFAQRAAGSVASHFDPAWGALAQGGTGPPSIEAYREMAASREARSHQDFAQMYEHCLRALEIDSIYTGALFCVADYHLWRVGEFQKGDSVLKILEANRDRLSPFVRAWVEIYRAWLDGDRERSCRLARSLAEQMPSGPNLIGWGWEAFGLNRPQEALDVYRSIDPERPDLLVGNEYWSHLTGVLHMLGEYEEELVQARRGQEQYPDFPGLAYQEGRALTALGRVEEALEVGEEIRVRWGSPGNRRALARALRTYGHPEAAKEVLESVLEEFEQYTPEEMAEVDRRNELAQTLYLLERYDEARDLYLDLRAEQPGNVDILGRLGVIAARLGEEEEARRIYNRLEGIERLNLQGLNHYWQACIAAQLRELDRAVRLLRQAHSEGRMFWVGFHTDVNLEPLHDHPAFEEFLRPKG
jgi:tetratricopeptide (TPR) repeat protein